MATLYAAGDLPLAGGINSLVRMLLENYTLSNTVSGNNNTTSTTYVALGGPSVVLTSTGTWALCLFSATLWNATSTNGAAMSVAVSGATTTAASDAWALKATIGSTALAIRASSFALLAINPGSNTYTAQYRSSAATAANFTERTLLVIAP